MKVKATKTTKITLSDIDALDPVTVILDDIAEGQGKIIIECYCKSWSSYWGAMGEQTNVAQFVCGCDEHYLAKNLSNISSTVNDFDKINKEAEKRDLSTMDESYLVYSTLEEIYGPEWFRDLPQKPNHEYVYLCRIINAVKDGLKVYLEGV